MQDRFQAPKGRGIGEHQPSQRRPVQPAAARGIAADRAGKGRLDRRNGRAVGALQRMHRGIGVEHRHAGPAEGRGGGGLAHADPARQPDDTHVPWLRPAVSVAEKRGWAKRPIIMKVTHACAVVTS